MNGLRLVIRLPVHSVADSNPKDPDPDLDAKSLHWIMNRTELNTFQLYIVGSVQDVSICRGETRRYRTGTLFLWAQYIPA